MKNDRIDSFSEIDQPLLNFMEDWYKFEKNSACALLYNIQLGEFSVPEVVKCIRIDSDLRVKFTKALLFLSQIC